MKGNIKKPISSEDETMHSLHKFYLLKIVSDVRDTELGPIDVRLQLEYDEMWI
jgi:hypothetical protein